MLMCERCKTPIEGQTARLCVLCFAACTVQCPDCTDWRGRTRRVYSRSGQRQLIDCETCRNDRYLTIWPAGVVWPGGLATGRSGRQGIGG